MPWNALGVEAGRWAAGAEAGVGRLMDGVAVAAGRFCVDGAAIGREPPPTAEALAGRFNAPDPVPELPPVPPPEPQPRASRDW